MSVPSWVPSLNGQVASIWLDFVNRQYWFSGAVQAEGDAIQTLISGGSTPQFDGANGLYCGQQYPDSPPGDWFLMGLGVAALAAFNALYAANNGVTFLMQGLNADTINPSGFNNDVGYMFSLNDGGTSPPAVFATSQTGADTAHALSFVISENGPGTIAKIVGPAVAPPGPVTAGYTITNSLIAMSINGLPASTAALSTPVTTPLTTFSIGNASDGGFTRGHLSFAMMQWLAAFAPDTAHLQCGTAGTCFPGNPPPGPVLGLGGSGPIPTPIPCVPCCKTLMCLCDGLSHSPASNDQLPSQLF